MPQKSSQSAFSSSKTDTPPYQTRGDIQEKATTARKTRLKKEKTSADTKSSLHRKRIQNIKRIQGAQEQAWERAAEEAYSLRDGDESSDANTTFSVVEEDSACYAGTENKSSEIAIIDTNNQEDTTKFKLRHYPAIFILTLLHFLHYIYQFTLSLFHEPKVAEHISKDKIK